MPHPHPPPDTTAPSVPHGGGRTRRVPDSGGRVLDPVLRRGGGRRLHRAPGRRRGRDRAGGATSYRDAALAASSRTPGRSRPPTPPATRRRRRPPRPPSTPYVRAQQSQPAPGSSAARRSGPRATASSFPGWRDADGDGCSHGGRGARRRGAAPARVGTGCALTGGRWRSPYDGRYRTRTSRLVVDHVVPLREAWRSGARGWRPALAASSPTTSATPRPCWRSRRGRQRRRPAGSRRTGCRGRRTGARTSPTGWP